VQTELNPSFARHAGAKFSVGAKNSFKKLASGRSSFTLVFKLSEYIDYHLSPEPATTIYPPDYPRILSAESPLNVTAQLGAPVNLHCVVRNLKDKTVMAQIFCRGRGLVFICNV
jgi:hypothetical protein